MTERTLVGELVTQEDRDAAAEIAALVCCASDDFIDARLDTHPLVQAFARHRIAALAKVRSWRCFHCGDLFTTEREARQHFGRDEGSTPACLIKGADGGLLRALRDAEQEADEAIQLMQSESTDASKAYHRQRCRHTQSLMAAEEAGYERGLADGRALSTQAETVRERAAEGADWFAGEVDCDGEPLMKVCEAVAAVEAIEPPDDPHSDGWLLGFCRARKMAADTLRSPDGRGMMQEDGRCPECGEDEVDGARCLYCGWHDYDCGLPDCSRCNPHQEAAKG